MDVQQGNSPDTHQVIELSPTPNFLQNPPPFIPSIPPIPDMPCIYTGCNEDPDIEEGRNIDKYYNLTGRQVDTRKVDK